MEYSLKLQVYIARIFEYPNCSTINKYEYFYERISFEIDPVEDFQLNELPDSFECEGQSDWREDKPLGFEVIKK